MKLSCLPVSLFPDITGGTMTLSNWIDLAADCGCDGADISSLFLQGHSFVYLEALKSMLRQKPIPIVMCASYPDFTHPDGLQRKREIAYFQRDIALCSELGIPYLRILAGQAHPGVSTQDGVAHAVSCMRKVAAFASTFGVTLLYENHGKPGAWQYIDLTYPPDLFLAVLDDVADTDIRVNFDIGNVTAYGKDPVALLERVYDRVETIHVSDMAQKGVFAPAAIGTGVAPIRDVFSLLKRRGFHGWLCIEEASFTGEVGICNAVKTTRRLWDEA